LFAIYIGYLSETVTAAARGGDPVPQRKSTNPLFLSFFFFLQLHVKRRSRPPPHVVNCVRTPPPPILSLINRTHNTRHNPHSSWLHGGATIQHKQADRCRSACDPLTLHSRSVNDHDSSTSAERSALTAPISRDLFARCRMFLSLY
jgi:hypothetical protein